MLDKLIPSSGGIRIAKVRSAVEAGAFGMNSHTNFFQLHLSPKCKCCLNL